MNKLIIFLLIIIKSGLIKTQLQLQSNQQSFSNVCQSGIREDNTNYIYCARRSLTEIPLFSKNNVIYDELVLSDNKINQLNINSFSRIKVKKVFLNGNPIKYIDPQSFQKLENNLEELWLDSDLDESDQINKIIGLPKAIQNLRNLNTLKLKGFLVKYLDNSILKRLNRIEILSLQFCSIETIDKHAFDGFKTSLKELYLDGNMLTSIPTEALITAGFKNLKILSLSQNNIKTINSDSFGYSFLNYYEFSASLNMLNKLDLSYNGLKLVESSAFNSFNSSLEILLLQNNELNAYNLKFIPQLQNLRELNLDFNLISNLASNLFINSAKLQYLSLQGNSIHFDDLIDNESTYVFDGLTGLQRLNLARNGIKLIPNGLFAPIRNLKSLILDKNLIENLNEFTFDGLFNTLMNISLQNTKIKSSNLISLRNFHKLERVKLGFNEIDYVDWSLFQENMHLSLSNLDLQNNKIKFIEFDRFNYSTLMENLVELDLSNNKLCEFNSNILEQVPKLKNLGLSQNPLYCDCNLLPLYEWTRRKFDKDILNYIQWQCELPEQEGDFFHKIKQKMVKFTSLNLNDFKCKNNTRSKCQPNPKQIKSTTTTTTASSSSTTTIQSHFLLAEQNSQQISRISNLQLKPSENSVLINWDLDMNDETIRGFKLTYSKSSNNSDMSTFLVDKAQRSFKIDNLSSDTKYTICVSIMRAHGYDKYCRDVDIESSIVNKKQSISQIKAINQSAPLTGSQITQITSDYLNTSSNIISGLMITILVVLVIFIFCLIIFLYFYIKRCRLNHKNLKKNLYTGCSANTLGSTTRRAVYQGAILTNTAEHKPIDITNTDLNKCCCILGQNTINNQRFIIHPNQNTIGRILTAGDTSTVSSTLSSVNNNANKEIMAISPNNNNNNNMTDWRFKPVNPNTVAVMTAELNSSTPTSFTHFIIQPNSQQPSNEQVYMPYEVYNCFQTGTQGTLIVPSQNLINNNINNNSKMFVNAQSNQILTTTTTNDHVYCEIPSTIGRSGYRPHQLISDGHFLVNNINNNNNNNNPNHNSQNTSTSLLLSSSTTSSATSSNSSSPQSNFTNNTKYTNASII